MKTVHLEFHTWWHYIFRLLYSLDNSDHILFMYSFVGGEGIQMCVGTHAQYMCVYMHVETQEPSTLFCETGSLTEPGAHQLG